MSDMSYFTNIRTGWCDELSIAAQQITLPILAITGTNGKSSTAYYTHQLLKMAGKRSFLGGNFGTPLSSLVPNQKDYDIAVVEVSSYQLEGAQHFHPSASAILNLTPDHLARHSNMECYAEMKRRIFSEQLSSEIVITNGDERIQPVNNIHWKLGAFPGAIIAKGQLQIQVSDKEYHFSLDEIPLLGNHNYWNVATAIMLCSSVSVLPHHYNIRKLRALEHRLELIRCVDNVRWVNDSKATNAEATLVALDGIDGPHIVLLGGAGKIGADYAQLLELLKEKARHVICFGQSSTEIFNQLSDHPSSFKIEKMQDALEQAQQLALSGDTIIFSPACASFDEFDNFMHRGATFRLFVDQLESK